ncbi:MAG: bifunctional oligoribonuclease/PAP phosphatase NrnA [Deltaproteobacteria bacterium]|nr:bifunctional oligoribonuclease/PAP phosphatase NrnA [Deltaproteobacteria bacterium]
MILNDIATIVERGKRFFLASHKDPDGDAIGSLLALGEALILSGKEVVLFNEGPIPDSMAFLVGSERIVDGFNPESEFDALFVLDCGTLERLGEISSDICNIKPLINIDHHENNSQFGDVNFVDTNSSSVGEIIYRLIQVADLPMSKNIAENLFVALQTDTGSFRYANTTKEAFTIAGEMVGWGINPWKISRRVMDEYSLNKLRLLELALKTIEIFHAGKVGLISITQQMFSKAKADNFDSERFVDYPRFISGVEIGVLIKELGKDYYKFSLRSNDWVNVADLAYHFGGGGHPKAAAFTRHGSLDSIKQEFLDKAHEVLGNGNS